jgi:hypothetical protein
MAKTLQFKKLTYIKYENEEGAIIEMEDLSQRDINIVNEFLRNNEVKKIEKFRGVIKR